MSFFVENKTSSSMPQFEKHQEYISKCELEWGAKLDRIPIGQYSIINPTMSDPHTRFI
jgi:hypothetical protein